MYIVNTILLEYSNKGVVLIRKINHARVCTMTIEASIIVVVVVVQWQTVEFSPLAS